MAKEMTAVEYFKGKKRMIRLNDLNHCELDCRECPLSKDNNEKNMTCTEFEVNCPESAVKIIEAWNEANPVKTMREDFFEKFPLAPTINGRTPFACAKDCYPVTCYKEGHTVVCEKCWERPLPLEVEA